MSQSFKGPPNRLRRALMELGGLFGFLFLTISFLDWLQDSLALG